MNNILEWVRLTYNEIIKIVLRKSFIVLCILLFLTTVVIGLYNLNTSSSNSDWEKGVKSQIDEISKENIRLGIEMDKETNEKLKVVDKQFIEENTKKIRLLEFALKQNVPYNVMTVSRFIYTTLDIMILIILFMVYYSANSVSTEYENGTIKQLLIKPIRRWKIFTSKYLSLISVSLFLCIILFSISLLVGIILFGKNGFGYLEVIQNVNGNPMTRNVLIYICQSYMLDIIQIAVTVAFAIMLSTVFKNNSISIISSILLLFSGSMITSIFSKQVWAKFLIFAHMDLKQYLEGNQIVVNGISLEFSIFVLAIYVISFLSISIYVFEKRDVC